MAMMHLDDSARGRIDRTSPVPMYEQLTHEIVAQIRLQNLAVGDALPGEHVLCARYGISRTVVRQSLADLEAQGIIHRVKGKGTFVGDGKIAETFVCSLRGLHDEVTGRGGSVRSVVLRHELTPATDEVALALEVAPGEQVIVLERLRVVDEEPWSWSTTWLPARLGAYLVGVDFETASLYRVLAANGVRPVSGQRTVEATIATPEQQELLDLADEPAVMVLKSITRDESSKVMEYFVAYHRGNRSRFEFDVVAPASEPGRRTDETNTDETNTGETNTDETNGVLLDW